MGLLIFLFLILFVWGFVGISLAILNGYTFLNIKTYNVLDIIWYGPVLWIAYFWRK